MSHIEFKIPIDNGQRGQIERGVRTHRHPDASRDCEDRPEYETDDGGLFDASEPLVMEMRQSKQSGGERHDQWGDDGFPV